MCLSQYCDEWGGGGEVCLSQYEWGRCACHSTVMSGGGEVCLSQYCDECGGGAGGVPVTVL